MTLVATRYTAVSRALGAWAAALEEAQRISLQALDTAVGPYRLLQAAASQPAGAGQLRAQGELDDARALLAKAVALRDQEAAGAARAIRAACNDKLADANWKFGLTGPAAGRVAALLELAAAGNPSALARLLALQRAGTEPGLAQAVSSWWQSLTPGQQHSLLQHDPQVAGALDGLPAPVRDAANRAVFNSDYTHVKTQIAQLEAELRGATSGILGLPVLGSLINDLDGTGAKQAELARLQGILTGMNAVRAALGQPGKGQPPVYLLGFDTSNLGHVIVSYGNPDTANNVVTYVPGLGSKLSSAGGDLTRTLRTYLQAHLFAPAAATASIYWLGYDAPQLSLSPLSLPGDLAVGYTNDARAAAPALDSFAAGLRAAHDPAFAAHTVVLGHSYGSVAVGEATVRAQGKLADDVIFVGSPGVTVNNADGLHMSGQHVWAGHAINDPVPDLPSWNPLSWASPDAAHFGTNPATPAFGGQPFQVAPGPLLPPLKAHSTYWDAGSTSLHNIGRIVDAQYNQVSLTTPAIPLHPVIPQPTPQPPPVPPAAVQAAGYRAPAPSPRPGQAPIPVP